METRTVRTANRTEAARLGYTPCNAGRQLLVPARNGESVCLRTADGRTLSIWIGESHFDVMPGDVRSIGNALEPTPTTHNGYVYSGEDGADYQSAADLSLVSIRSYRTEPAAEPAAEPTIDEQLETEGVCDPLLDLLQ